MFNTFPITCPLENAVMLKSKCPSRKYWFERDLVITNHLNRVDIMIHEISGIEQYNLLF